MVTSDSTIEQLLSELDTGTRAIVCETWLAADIPRLLQLRSLAPNDQRTVARRIGLEMPWDDAVKYLPTPEPAELIVEPAGGAVEVEPEKATAVSSESSTIEVTADAERDPSPTVTEPHLGGGHDYAVETRRVDALRANNHNARLFPDSLGDAAIALIAVDLEAHGQHVPVRITPSGTIVDGERRWRGAQRLGWSEIRVVVGPELTDAEMLDHVISACTSARQMSVREQTNIYLAIVDSLTRTAGVTQGRPSRKRSPNGDLFVRSAEIRKAAAAKARFASAKLAERAEVVFKRAPQDVQDRVCAGELSISAAYELVPKRPRTLKVNDNGGSPSEVFDTGSGSANDSGDETVDTIGDAGASLLSAASSRHADELAEGGADPNGPMRGSVSDKSPLDAAVQVGLGVTQRDPNVPIICELFPDEANAKDARQPQRTGARDTRLVLARDRERSQKSGMRPGRHAADRAMASGDLNEVLERALNEVETYGDGLAASNAEEAAQALAELARRLNEMLARWAWACNPPIDEDHYQDEDDSIAEREDDDELADGIDSEEHEHLVDDEESETEAPDSDEWDAQSDEDADSNDDTPKDDIDLEVARVLGMKRR